MLTPETAQIAIAIAKGLIKLAGHLDNLLAEKVAVQGPLALKLPKINFAPGPNVVGPRLQKYLDQTSETEPGPLGDARKDLVKLLAQAPPDLGRMRSFFALVYPGDAAESAVDPDAEYLKFLRDNLPGLRAALPSDPNDKSDPARADTYKAALYTAAFYVEAGGDNRQLGYTARVGLLVVDVLAEFGSENTQLFVRDEGLQSIVHSVLQRFAKPDLESFDQWSPLLRHVLSSTLNGVLDARAAYAGTNPWVGALLQALVEARDAAGADGDNFLLGLLRGQGYQLLLSKGLEQAAQVLDQEDAGVFSKIASDFLKEGSNLLAGQPVAFRTFFEDHWADLLHAGLVALDKHGSELLEPVGQGAPLLQAILLSSLHSLAQAPGSELLTRDTLMNVADAAIGAFASHPELWKNGIKQEWLAALIQSVTRTVSDQGIQATFSKDGLETILRAATATVAEHPEWIVKNPGLLQSVVGGVLKQFGDLNALDAKSLGLAAVQGALQAIAARPDLLDTKYADVIASFAGVMADKVKANALSAFQASELIDAAASAVLLNPRLFADADKKIAALIVNAVTRAVGDKPGGLLAGSTLVAVVRELFGVFAQRGMAKAQGSLGDLETQLAALLQAGLVRADAELGQKLTLPAVPEALSGLVAAWLRGDVPAIDPGQVQFISLFAGLAESASAQT